MGITGDRAIWKAESEGFELLNITIGDLVDQQAAVLSDKEALVYHYPERGLDLRLTYRALCCDEVNRVARGLLALDIEKGEHVAVWAPNVPEWIFLIAFGMTEASGYISHTLSTDTYELKSSTVGIPLPDIDVQLVNPQMGKPVGFGERGELLTRGFLVMKGYYQMPDKTAEVIDADGWLHTGDLATMNAQGYIAIVGRLKDMIIRGGENLYPAEIEGFLMRHPKVAEAQIVGVPDPFMGEELVALLKLKPGEHVDEGEIRDYCRGAISKRKISRYIRFVTAYPLTASGKVKKFELRVQFIEELRREG